MSVGKTLCGGTSELKAPDAESKAIAIQVKSAIETESGNPYELFTLLGYKTQVVAGRNYFLKLQVGESEALHARVFMSLQGDVSLHSIQTGKKIDDSLDYF